MSSILVSILLSVLQRLVSEKVVIGVLVGLGDWLVPKTTNKLDDEIWAPVREALSGEAAAKGEAFRGEKKDV